MFLFGSKSTSCDDEKEDKPSENDDLSSLVLEAGLEPARRLNAKGF